MRILGVNAADLYNDKIKYDLMILAGCFVTEVCLIYCMLFENLDISDSFLLLVWTVVLAATALLIRDVVKEYTILRELQERSGDTSGRDITRVSLLNENDGIIYSWSVYGKISVVIGRDVRENHVDIDLSRSKYAGQIAVEHAVMNWANGEWYIEDISEDIGIDIKKNNGKRQKLADDTACKIEYGDIIYIGAARLLVG